jgi:hypothetical protein
MEKDFKKDMLISMYILINSIYFLGFIIAVELFFLLSFYLKMVMLCLISALGIILILKTRKFFKLVQGGKNGKNKRR